MEGYMENAQGHQVPLGQVKEIDKQRHELVMELVEQILTMREALRDLKGKIMGDVEAFVQLSAEEYGVNLGGRKGNTSLTSFDGKYKIQRAISDSLVFDERLLAAEELIGQCLSDWTKGSPGELKAIVDKAFDTDKEGKINVARVLGLRSLKIDDARWKKAMDAISDSLHAVGSKTYFRVQERQEDGSYMYLPLDIAKI